MYRVYIFANDNIRYRNKQRIIRNYNIKEIKTFYGYRITISIYIYIYIYIDRQTDR